MNQNEPAALRTAALPAPVPADRVVLVGVLALAALSTAGAVISVAGDLSPTYLDAVGPRGRLSIPLPMTVFQVVMALAAGSRRRPWALIGSAAVAVGLLLGVVSGFFDGGYADGRLGTLERTTQVVLVSTMAIVGLLAVARFVRVLRGRRVR